MIRALRELLAGLTAAPAEEAEEQELELAVAVLLVEMARADHKVAATEAAEIQAQLETHFSLAGEAAAGLLQRARAIAEDSVSLHDFTRAVHEGMDYDEKLRVVEMLWRVALADLSLDKYEDYLIAKIGELLYVSRGDVMRLKYRVTEQLRAARDS